MEGGSFKLELLDKINDIDEYIYHLGKNKDELKLSWKDISLMIKGKFNKELSGDYIRHQYYGMDKKEIIEIAKDDGYTKVLILNDLHLPYQRDDVFDIIEENKDVDYILIGGDLIDCEACSFWDVWDRPSVEEELIIAHEFISKINTIVNPNKTKIISILGNHENRYERDIVRLQEKQLQKLLNPKLLSMLEKGFTYYERDKDVTYKPIENFSYVDHWYAKFFGNLVLAHPTEFSSIDGRLNEKVADYFLNQNVSEKGDVLIYGHSHKYSNAKVNRRQGIFVIENGCLCKPMEYAKKSAKLSFTPQNYCYTRLKFIEGEKINLNDIQTVHLD